MDKEIPARLTPAEGRKFAFTVGAAFLVLAGITWWREHPMMMRVFSSLGGVLLLAGIVVPGKLGPIQRAWMGLAHLISKVTTPIFMGVTYFLVLTPVGLVMRAMGRNPMVHQPVGDSYWMTRGPETGTRGDLNRQF